MKSNNIETSMTSYGVEPINQVRLNNKNKKLHSSNMNEEILIYPNSMNREDLSKMTKQQLIDMLLGQKPIKPEEAKRPIPASRKFGVKQMIRYFENNPIPAYRPVPAPRIKKQKPIPTVRQKIKHFENLSD